MTGTEVHFSEAMIVLVMIALTIVGFLVVPLSRLVLRFYRRRVIRLMETSGTSGVVSPPGDETVFIQKPPSTNIHIELTNQASSIQLNHDAQQIHAKTLKRPWQTAAIYLMAGCCYILLIAIVFFRVVQEVIKIPPLFVNIATLIWPAILVTIFITNANKRMKRRLIYAYFLSFLFFSIFDSIFWQRYGASSTLSKLLNDTFHLYQINFGPSLLMFFAFNRRARAVSPMVLLFLLLPIIGMGFIPVTATSMDFRRDLLERLIMSSGVTYAQVMIPLAVLGGISFAFLGWLVLKLVRNRYERKQASDQSLLVDTAWLLFVQWHLTYLFLGYGPTWLLYGIVAYIVFRIVVWAGFKTVMRTIASKEKPVNLLLLRVFSLGKRSERLYDALSTHWRYIGNLRLIAGPDLATTTIEPHEFLDYLTGKLDNRFIDSEETLDRRMVEVDNIPDQDGRYRVSEFFCHANIWKTVLARLASSHDIVVMDLRSFSTENAGCIFEINALVDLVSLDQVVFIIDDSTDLLFLTHSLEESWTDMAIDSPNRNGSKTAQLFQLDNVGSQLVGFSNLLKLMCESSTSSI